MEPDPIKSVQGTPPPPSDIWLHGLIMLVLVILVHFAQALLAVCAVLQFVWMLFAKERNEGLARFGRGVANWLSITARFVTGASDEKPFPWTSW